MSSQRQIWMAPPARFELALPPPEGGALSPELRGRAISVPKPVRAERNVPAWHAAPGPSVFLDVTSHVRELIRQRTGGLVWHSFAM